MRNRRVWAAWMVMAGFVTLIDSATACMWDSDTIAMERADFPDALELITGKFARHSEAFYRWRIEDRLKRIPEEPDNLALLDDLAVAYDKVGDHAAAIATMLQKEERQPGLYETTANLGTFYIHAGELEKGLAHIEKAIAINPDAHFGREIYQKHLVEYVRYVRDRGNPGLPLRLVWPPPSIHDGPEPGQRAARGFVDWIPVPEVNHAAAVKGVLGMMRFGNHDSPVLLEALGDLLAYGLRYDDRSGLLASRAYLRASYEVEGEDARTKYRELATAALRYQTGGKRHQQLTLDELESDFKIEMAEAEAWYAQVEANELAWIEGGLSPEVKFAEKYYEVPSIKSAPIGNPRFIPYVMLTLLGSAVLFLVYLRVRKRRKPKGVQTAATETD